MQDFTPALGTPKQELDTPSFIVDLDAMENNIEKMASYCKSKSINLRPHTKHHKSPDIAKKQIEAGAIGICCQKLGEAETMASHGIDNILLTYEIIGSFKIRRLVTLAKTTNVSVTVDDIANVADLSEAANVGKVSIGVLLDVNVGQNRCGIEPDESVVALAQAVEAAPGLQFLGIHAYNGAIQSVQDDDTRRALDADSMKKTLAAIKYLQSAEIPCDIVTAGGTGTYNMTGSYPYITEIQPGSYVFMDAQYGRVLPDFTNAGTILASVISRPTQDRAVIDCGMKALSTDQWPPIVKAASGLTVASASDEHLTITLESEKSRQLRPGDKVELIPGHNDTTVNLHTHLFGIRNNKLEVIWPVSARAMIR